MIETIFKWGLELFLSWATVAFLVGIMAGAAWWFLPAVAVKLRALAFNVMLGAFAFSSVSTYYYTTGVSYGLDLKAAEWSRANEREQVSGEKARSDAVATVERSSPEWVLHDRYNRDTRTKQGTNAPSPVRGLGAH